MEDFKQYLSEDADDRQQEAAKQVMEGLADLQLKKKVAEAAANRRILLRQRFWRQLILAALIVVIAGIAFWLFGRKEATIPSFQIPKQMEETNPPQLPQTSPVQEQAIELLQKESIVDGSSMSSETKKDSLTRYVNPKSDTSGSQLVVIYKPKRPISPQEQAEEPWIRGLNPELDAKTDRLINILLRITLNNDSAYNLKNSNENYGWGKIVEFLRKNDPIEARAEIYNFCGTPVTDKECLWLLAIARLQLGHHEDAQVIFERIAKDPDHHRRKEAQLAVEALQ